LECREKRQTKTSRPISVFGSKDQGREYKKKCQRKRTKKGGKKEGGRELPGYSSLGLEVRGDRKKKGKGKKKKKEQVADHGLSQTAWKARREKSWEAKRGGEEGGKKGEQDVVSSPEVWNRREKKNKEGGEEKGGGRAQVPFP